MSTETAALLDRLVELHVLAENGDDAAADAARELVATDPEAKRVWETVERTCEEVRAAQR